MTSLTSKDGWAVGDVARVAGGLAKGYRVKVLNIWEDGTARVVAVGPDNVEWPATYSIHFTVGLSDLRRVER